VEDGRPSGRAIIGTEAKGVGGRGEHEKVGGTSKRKGCPSRLSKGGIRWHNSGHREYTRSTDFDRDEEKHPGRSTTRVEGEKKSRPLKGQYADGDQDLLSPENPPGQ